MTEHRTSRRDVESITPYGSEQAKGEQVEAMFDSIAPAYDFMNRAMTFGLHVWWRNRALSRLKNVPHNDILDLATGTGDVALALWRKYRPARITGLDLSEGMLAVARRKLESMEPDARRAIDFVKGDCLQLPFGDEEFDAITVAYGVRNFEHLLDGLRQMHRVLRPGGTLCVVELSQPQGGLTRSLYNFYSRRLIPALGKMVSGDSSAYTYLPQSIAGCPQRDDMAALMRRAGFDKCTWRSLTFGVVTIYLAEKL